MALHGGKGGPLIRSARHRTSCIHAIEIVSFAVRPIHMMTKESVRAFPSCQNKLHLTAIFLITVT